MGFVAENLVRCLKQRCPPHKWVSKVEQLLLLPLDFPSASADSWYEAEMREYVQSTLVISNSKGLSEIL